MSSASIHPEADTGTAKLRLSQRAPWQVLVLTAVYVLPAFLCLRHAWVGDLDIWWHMKAGQWILHHNAFPYSDPFSSYAAGKTWIAYSWLFDLIVLKAYGWLGLNGVVAYTAGMLVAITMAYHRLIRRAGIGLTPGVLLTLAAVLCIAPLWTARSWMFSILLFTVQLDVLVQARRSGGTRELWCLPAIYVLWANVHIQFIDGLVVLAIAVLEAAFAYWWDRSQTPIGFGRTAGVFAACAGAVLVNPYGFGIYTTAYGLASQQGVLNSLVELRAMPFRDIFDYGVVFLAFGAVAALARARSRRLFECVLLLFSVVVSFRSQRDVWILVTVSAAIMAAGSADDRSGETACKAWAAPAASLLAVIVAILGFAAFHVNNGRLAKKLGETLPVHAAEFVRTNNIQGSLFNNYDWGGYLMWSTDLPVSIDGRAELVGDGLFHQSAATWAGAPDWACDPQLQKAQLVIGPVTAPLTQLLRLNSHFKLAYEDKLAAVFVVQVPSSTDPADGPVPLPCTSGR